ncbi:MAG: hypothetical protein IKH18_07500 [Clostridia bacterium]|nr:hypothetical protein [Clostridia bacterium]
MSLHAYCLFCDTRRCGEIARLIESRYECHCFSPRMIQRKWVKGIPEEEIHDWLPGYVFLYTEEPLKQRIDVSGIIRVLGNGELEGADREFAQMLYQRGGVLGSVCLIQEGDRCRIADPAWAGAEGTVIRMDRGRKRCCVEFIFDEKKHSVWVGYEILEPDSDTGVR